MHTIDEIKQLSRFTERSCWSSLAEIGRSPTCDIKMSQTDMIVMKFVVAVDDQPRLSQANTQPITEENLVRMALVDGMRDRALAEKALAEKYTLDRSTHSHNDDHREEDERGQ